MCRNSYLDIDEFVSVTPSSIEFTEAWATSFVVGAHQYSLRIETAFLAELGLEGFCVEQGIHPPDHGKAHFIKFDNALNEQNPAAAFGRLPPAHRLQITELRQLAFKLAGGIELFCLSYQPDILIGVPNDSKLELWYRHLCQRNSFAGHLLDVRPTHYHSHGVLFIQRL
jgi:hypothetical protein